MLRVNCGDLVPAGIVGYTLTKAMTYLHLKAGSEIKKTAQGLLHFDEFDKLAIHNHINDDQWKTTTQFEMLKFFDLNEKIIFPCSFEQFARPVQMSTNNLMLVFSGAFQGLDAIIYSRLITEFDGNTKLIDKDNLMLYCTGDDIQKYGIIPELAGRLTFISPLNKLTSTDIYSILTRAKESEFSKHVKKCELMGVRIRFTENALRCIAQKVADQNLGARYINTIMTQILKDVYFNVHNYRKGELWIDDKRVLHACNSNRNLMLFREFDNNTDLAAIAEKFDIKVDNLLDIYLEYKSLKNGGQNNVI
jgi:ATP-dependent Clp protease ATP-binding subunit ClpX